MKAGVSKAFNGRQTCGSRRALTCLYWGVGPRGKLGTSCLFDIVYWPSQVPALCSHPLTHFLIVCTIWPQRAPCGGPVSPPPLPVHLPPSSNPCLQSSGSSQLSDEEDDPTEDANAQTILKRGPDKYRLWPRLSQAAPYHPLPAPPLPLAFTGGHPHPAPPDVKGLSTGPAATPWPPWRTPIICMILCHLAPWVSSMQDGVCACSGSPRMGWERGLHPCTGPRVRNLNVH